MAQLTLFSLQDPNAAFKGTWFFHSDGSAHTACLHALNSGLRPMYVLRRESFATQDELLARADQLRLQGWSVRAETNPSKAPIPLKPRPLHRPSAPRALAIGS
jgi:hypothetical protein